MGRCTHAPHAGLELLHAARDREREPVIVYIQVLCCTRTSRRTRTPRRVTFASAKIAATGGGSTLRAVTPPSPPFPRELCRLYDVFVANRYTANCFIFTCKESTLSTRSHRYTFIATCANLFLPRQPLQLYRHSYYNIQYTIIY